jgi:hypothetical protein
MNAIKLRLVLDVEYLPNGESVGTLKEQLTGVVVEALNWGGFTGQTAAEVESHSFTVEEVKP